jgi:hypothetical protein
MKTKLLFFVVVVLLLVGVVCFLVSNSAEPITREQAMARWAEVVKNGYKGQPREMALAFKECFRKNDSVWDYEELLATAKERREGTEGRVEYSWYGNPREDDLIFTLVVENYVIVDLYIHEWLR